MSRYKKMGESIRLIRRLRGFTQENMADALKISRITYSEIEKGTKSLTPDRLKDIAKELGVKEEDIMSFEDNIKNFFENCNNLVLVNNDTVNQHITDELFQLKLDLANAEIGKLKAEKEKLEMEVAYLKLKLQQQEGQG